MPNIEIIDIFLWSQQSQGILSYIIVVTGLAIQIPCLFMSLCYRSGMKGKLNFQQKLNSTGKYQCQKMPINLCHMSRIFKHYTLSHHFLTRIVMELQPVLSVASRDVRHLRRYMYCAKL